MIGQRTRTTALRRPRWTHSVLAAAAAVLVLASSAVPAQAAPAATSATSCAKYVAIMTPGTWETNAAANPTAPVGMLATVGNALKQKYGNDIEVYYPAYAASAFDKGRTYADSKETGKSAINNILTSACASAKFLLSGYSQGADAAGDVAAEIGNGRGVVPAARILGVGLVADPHQGTAGGTVVGPKVDGQGIGGVRPEGFGSLAPVVKQLCNPTDLYCSTNAGKDGLLAGLGKVLANKPVDPATTGGQAGTGSTPAASSAAVASPTTAQGGVTGAGTQPGTTPTQAGAVSDFSSSLVSDFSRVDLAGAANTASTLGERVATLPESVGTNRTQSQVASVGASATSLLNTLEPVADVQSVIAANPGIRSTLDTAPEGSPEAKTSTVLDALDQIDIPAVLSTATSIADTASSVLGGTGTTAGLAGPASTLSGQVAPLQSVSPDALTSATQVLSLLKPKTVVNQVVNVATGFTSLDYQGIIDNLIALPQKVAALDVAGSHKIAGDLNNQFAPIVKMAAGVDLHTLAALVAMIPDPSGFGADRLPGAELARQRRRDPPGQRCRRDSGSRVEDPRNRQPRGGRRAAPDRARPRLGRGRSPDRLGRQDQPRPTRRSDPGHRSVRSDRPASLQRRFRRSGRQSRFTGLVAGRRRCRRARRCRYRRRDVLRLRRAPVLRGLHGRLHRP
ncbi:MAG: cutinase family protein [Rhodococcus sp. (in: high G+C Gram-positive bacteria)]|uniref:cutinase family protein n=1 Tax=Rhodococcus sp. TaxID=1831 RepID=UPI002AD62987|nr:cutinase family protein [Rhodococcus sp. (in: high G+C Gram-positive bacteria)]